MGWEIRSIYLCGKRGQRLRADGHEASPLRVPVCFFEAKKRNEYCSLCKRIMISLGRETWANFATVRLRPWIIPHVMYEAGHRIPLLEPACCICLLDILTQAN